MTLISLHAVSDCSGYSPIIDRDTYYTIHLYTICNKKKKCLEALAYHTCSSSYSYYRQCTFLAILRSSERGVFDNRA